MLKPRESIARLRPYHSPIVSRAGLSLDLNESMAGCSPRVLARLRSLSAAEVSLYPEREVGERLIANFLGIAPEQVLLTTEWMRRCRCSLQPTSAQATNCC